MTEPQAAGAAQEAPLARDSYRAPTQSRPSQRLRTQSPRLGTALPALGLGLVTLLVFWNDLVHGLAYYGSDTVSFYYPLTNWYAAQLRSGQLPLWLPHIFGGYPLFADGEVGMLYPLNLLAYGLLPSDTAFVWLRPLHFWLAGLFTYWLARLLGVGRFGGLVAGLTFSYGSFLVSHVQHENLIRSTIWLPLALGLLELALRSEGRQRLTRLLACGVVMGVQMLGVHVQPVLLSLLVLGLYSLVGPLVRDPARGRSGWGYGEAETRRRGDAEIDEEARGREEAETRGHAGSRPRRPTLAGGALGYLWTRVWALGLVTLVGLGLSAVQLLPLYQLGERSVRLGEISYEFSTSYSIPPTQLIQLLLPYLFRPDPATDWGLWSAAETTVYLGIAPLLLALVGLAYLRTRVVAFFSFLAGSSLVISLGDYSPIGLYGLIWSLPGFSIMRAPARFSLLFVLAGALLAGLGAQWLASRSFDRRPGDKLRPGVRRLALLAFGFIIGAVILAAFVVLARAWLDQDPDGTRRAIETTYLTLRRGDWRLSASQVYFGLLRSMDLGNSRTLGALVLMVCAAAWLLLRGLHHMPRRLWQAGLVVLVAVDLVTFARAFYPQKPVGELKLSSPVIQFLAERNAAHRVFIEPSLFGQLGPNQLVPWNIDFAGGYSSLEPRRATEYWWSVVRQDNILLDLYNIRYVVEPRNTPGLLSFQGTLFHPSDRLMRGALGNPSGTETFQFEPWWTEALTVLSAAERVRDLPYGEPLAEVTIRGRDGERRLQLVSGRDVEDGSAPRLGPPLPGASFGPRIAWAGPLFQNPHQLSVVYGTTLQLDEPILATSLTINRIGPNVPLDVYGLGLHDRPGLPVRSIASADRAKYHLAYQDEDVKIFENRAVLPRAFLVPSARVASETRSIVEQLFLGAFDPRRTILLDGSSGQELGPGDPSDEVGTAELVEHGAERVVVRVDARGPGYLVLDERYDGDWAVKVDGSDVPLLRANAMFRAVSVDAGAHEVVFMYEPLAVRAGAAVSLVSVALLVLIGLWVRRARCRAVVGASLP